MAKQTQGLEELPVSDLRERAKDAGLTGTSHMRKGELVEALRHDDGAPDAGGTAKAAGRNGAGPDVLSLLKEDHENVKALFKQALEKKDGDPEMEQLARQIVSELKLHTQAEESIFYPALKEKAVDEDFDDAKHGVLEAYIEHASVKELIAKVESMSASDESYKAVIQVMSEQVEHHVEEEESEMFKQARKLLGKDELASIGAQIADLKKSAKTPA